MRLAVYPPHPELRNHFLPPHLHSYQPHHCHPESRSDATSTARHVSAGRPDETPSRGDRAARITHLEQLGNYIGSIAATNKAELLACGGMPDHLHLLINLPTSISLGELVSKLKANSSRWLAQRTPGFQWQEGYGAFSVSASALNSVRHYIATQPEHHKTRDYDQELATLLRL